ncbi:MAG TPA: hypothetical protein DD432_06870 [Eubacterium sp.]|nr:hypothetical protein [Eubacterium sp.]
MFWNYTADNKCIQIADKNLDSSKNLELTYIYYTLF